MLSNCPQCRRPFVAASGSKSCADCIFQEQEQLQKVRTYLSRNPGSTPDEIAAGTRILLEKITHWIKQGKISASQQPPRPCTLCGTPMLQGESGREAHGKFLCRGCMDHMAGQLRSAVNTTLLSGSGDVSRLGKQPERRYGTSR